MKHPIALALVLLVALPPLKAQTRNTAGALAAREASFNQALLRADWQAVEQIEADDLIFTNADGSVTHKSDDVANLRSGDLKFESIVMSDVVVQNLGDVGVVTGKLVETVRYQTTDLSGTYRFTDVWVRRDGRWQLVAGQETLVRSPK